mgnify:CR=1 FL=1
MKLISVLASVDNKLTTVRLNIDDISSMYGGHDNYYNYDYTIVSMKNGQSFDCRENQQQISRYINAVREQTN